MADNPKSVSRSYRSRTAKRSQSARLGLSREFLLAISEKDGEKSGRVELPRFRTNIRLPKTEMEKMAAVHCPIIRRIIHFCLGPVGTNIEMAARQWARRFGVSWKSSFIPTRTPEEAVRHAHQDRDKHSLGVFWTCAVFKGENEIFFRNTDSFPFFFSEEMALDGMNLSIRADLELDFLARGLSPKSRIATHPSPAPLIEELPNEVVFADSNASAARMCTEGKTEACVTTERAAKQAGLKIVHFFGSPPMVFFGGIPLAGAKLIARAHQRQGAEQ